MGREATCAVTWKRRRFDAKVLLESESVVVRGDVRLSLAFGSLTRIDVSSGRLTLEAPAGTLVLDLGDEAERWAARIRNPPTLADKLGITRDTDVTIVGIGDEGLVETLRARAKSVVTDRLTPGASIVVAGLHRASDLRRFGTLKDAIAPDGAIWTVRPKGVAEVSESAVRAAALAAGLVDVKVARVSATHTAEKFVIPRAARGASTRK
jgi:hypothetical protein